MKHCNFFNNLAERWDAMEREDIGQRLARVVAEAAVHPGQHILDVGTGTGVLIPYLLEAMQEKGHILVVFTRSLKSLWLSIRSASAVNRLTSSAR
ncbi:MAG: hypothetical protein PHO05_09150, partial [bacterium]|nr:hypothetical protein [bacterium]